MLILINVKKKSTSIALAHLKDNKTLHKLCVCVCEGRRFNNCDKVCLKQTIAPIENGNSFSCCCCSAREKWENFILGTDIWCFQSAAINISRNTEHFLVVYLLRSTMHKGKKNLTTHTWTLFFNTTTTFGYKVILLLLYFCVDREKNIVMLYKNCTYCNVIVCDAMCLSDMFFSYSFFFVK